MQALAAKSQTGAVVHELLGLSVDVLTALNAHPLTTSLRHTMQAYLTLAGASEDTLALQPLRPSYNHAAHAYAAAAAARGGGDAVTALWQRWCALAAALPHAALQEHAQRGADAAVAAGAASAYQLSVWRQARPEQRALRDAPHPIIDHLAPVLAHITTVEDTLLSTPVPMDKANSMAPVWSADVAVALARLQEWRAALWRCCHGSLHTRDGAMGGAGADAGLLPAADVIAWLWRQLQKACERLARACESCTTGAAGGSGSGVAQVLNALRVSLTAGAEALGLDHAPCKPLGWSVGGHPILPRTHTLLNTQLHTAALANASALPAAGASAGASGGLLDAARLLDGRGYPACVAAARLDAVALVDAAIAARDAYWDPTGASEGSAATRERVSVAVAATLLTDTGLREALHGGAALVEFAPVGTELATRVAKPSAPHQSTLKDDKALLTVPSLLRGRIETAVTDTVGQSMAFEGAGEADVTAQLGVTATLMKPPQQGPLLLPAALMVSPACRALQTKLLVLQV